ncbi:methyltransferase [Streptomyces monticola]|uniref:Methyltransferase n=1 Tax=Streptomyces monticola TaxID=2666263 RepID=A0ABW2JUA4_9ACTN
MMTTQPLLAPSAIDALRDVLTSHGYTREGIVARVGIEAAQGLNRYDPTLALQLLGEGDPLAVLIQLFMCGRTVRLRSVEPGVVPLLETAGEGLVRAAVYLHPYEKWWALSDFPRFLRPDPQDRRADGVQPIGPDATLLRRATLTHRVESALDLGTGGGVQALHLSGQAARVTATDLSPRAVRFAATTAALNGLDWEVLHGDMAQPVAGRRFDLVVSNPPFAVGPGTVHCVHRDSGRPGDGLCAELAGNAPELLTEGGYLQFRAHWLHRAGEDWRERVADWIPGGAGLDAWIVQRSAAGVVPYVDQWLELGGGEEALGQREAWLRWFEGQKAEAVGMGTVVVRRSGRERSAVRVEELSAEAGELTGAQVAGWFARQDWLRAHDPLAERLTPGHGLTLWQQADHRDGAGWQLAQQVLKVPGDGLNWSERVSPLAVALLGGAGRDATIGEQVARLAEAEGTEPGRLAEAALPEVARLVERGALVPTAPDATGPGGPDAVRPGGPDAARLSAPDALG